jgi:hypothetical protein
MCRTEIVNMEPTILWQSIFNEIFILILVFAHVDGVLATASCEIIDHKMKGEQGGEKGRKKRGGMAEIGTSQRYSVIVITEILIR